MSNNAPLAVMAAMDSEYELIAAAVQDAVVEEAGNFRFTVGTFSGHPIVAVRCRIGMVNSAAAATLTIERFHPSCFLLQGTAGAHDPTLHQGDIVLGEKLINPMVCTAAHRDLGEGSCQKEWELHGTEMKDGDGSRFVTVFHSDPHLLSLARSIPYTGGRVVTGTVASSDVWNRELDTISFFHDSLGTLCEEMEGAAVAQVCEQFGVPFLDVRVISNSEWYPEESFSESYALPCQQFCLEFLHRLINKT